MLFLLFRRTSCNVFFSLPEVISLFLLDDSSSSFFGVIVHFCKINYSIFFSCIDFFSHHYLLKWIKFVSKDESIKKNQAWELFDQTCPRLLQIFDRYMRVTRRICRLVRWSYDEILNHSHNRSLYMNMYLKYINMSSIRLF
jgi:hypothetical protein